MPRWHRDALSGGEILETFWVSHRENVPSFFLLVRDDYYIFARKGVIFHSSTGVLPLFGLLKGLLFLFLLLLSKLSRYCLHTLLLPVSLPAEHCAVELSLVPVPDMVAPRGGPRVLHYTHIIGERKKKMKGGEGKEKKKDYKFISQLVLRAARR